MHKKLQFSLLAGLSLFLAACSGGAKDAAEGDDAAVKSTPLVSVAKPITKTFSNTITFTGTTQYQQKGVIRAGIAGYIHQYAWKPGDQVRVGTTYCTITSKEQQALKGIDQSGILKKFSNPIPVVCGTAGVLTAVNYQNGDFVAEGDILATFTEQSSLALLVNVPVEYLSKVNVGTACTVLMPDGSKLETHLRAGLPTADPAVQTQSFVVPLGASKLPEGANIKVSVTLSEPQAGMAVPVSAVQTDETQQHFWVFKIGKDNMAIKVEVQAGAILPDSLQKIQTGNLTLNDQVITDGAYGLADSSKVKIKQ